MRILFLVENYFPKMSGVPVVTKYLAEGLKKLGHDIFVLTKAVTGSPNEEVINGIKITRMNIGNEILLKRLHNNKKYINFVTSFECEVMIFECSQCLTTDLILPYLKDIKAKKILHSHGFSGLTLKPIRKMSTLKNTIGNSYKWAKWNAYYKTIFKKYVNKFEKVLCLSELDSSLEYLKDYYNGETAILSNAADDMFFHSVNDGNPIEYYTRLNSRRYIISVANYSAYKNQIGILDEFYKTEVKDLDMVFIGSKENIYYNALIEKNTKLEKTHGKKDVHFLVGVERRDIPMLIKNSCIYLCGSTFEEFSISLIEAMALSVPFISTNVGNARVLPGGITINNMHEMHDTIMYLLENDEIRIVLGEKGCSYAFQNCKIDKIVNRLDKLISE